MDIFGLKEKMVADLATSADADGTTAPHAYILFGEEETLWVGFG